MSVRRFPVLVLRDFADYHTACWVEEPGALAAVARTSEKALDQVQDFLAWRLEEGADIPDEDFLDPQLLWISVSVRPEYKAGDRMYPCGEPIRLRLPCVKGRRASGTWVGSVPTLGLRFEYYEEDSFKSLVQHYAEQCFKGREPMEVSRFLPPPEAFLEEVRVKLPSPEEVTEHVVGTEALASVAEPLGIRTALSKAERCWEREGEVSELQGLFRAPESSILLLGEAGTGKSAVLHEAIRRAERAAREEGRKAGPRFWKTSASRLIAGMRYLGQWEERCQQVIQELSEIGGVLCVESLMDLVRLGGEGADDSLASFLLAYLQRGEVRMVAEATPGELDACRRILPAFADVFRGFAIQELSRKQAVSLLDCHAAYLTQNLKVQAAQGVTSTVFRLFSRFQPYQGFPGKCLSFLQDLFDEARRDRRKKVETDDVLRLFVRRTGLPEVLLRDELPLSLETVLGALREKVLGQEAACRAAAGSIVALKTGLNDPRRPLGVFLFAGPTGVGKTELAKTIASFLFGGGGDAPRRLIRVDMSEFSGPYAAQRFLGSEGEISVLVRRIREQPFSVVLLDEIEKADPAIFDILLGICDEARLTDRFGRVTRFHSALVIMTSNIGSDAREPAGFGKSPGVSYESEVQAFFRPEFYNRLDGVVQFQPLTRETIDAITVKELSEIARREGLLEARRKLTWTEGVVRFLSEKGFDQRYGARPLQRTLDELVITPLSEILIGRPALQDAEIRIDVEEGRLRFEVLEGRDAGDPR
jgi:ATP-dependent Clp protease ATP-binding subunit ClpC